MLLLLILFTLSFAAKTKGCSCMYTPAEKLLCQSEFAILAVITSQPQEIDEWHKSYGIYIIGEFKKASTQSLRSDNFILTPSNDGVCGQDFEVNQTYLITGNIVNGNLYTMTCDLVKNWDQLDEKRKRYYRNFYRTFKCENK
ncbi:metalloproteinase inhibitor 4-like protein [Dinothrombium tinctorium]|uniref:Metalloproteinase inhibitor 4-like protein n=1 Tax=Dinothrombium tinctorium TaxID=1965070 RepID=A0A3S3S5I5_9ACAR|nr:metalloproteinase inhibitor 4-like protein [Dinothrombium tinctorium]RWS09458.1 metalloproteinase inhibitor 4-like protein [Dinothrombium tinctorium]RWS09463.1 metalloproteinase inhibitor 4-like protein [Dinothrombium tinctorium]